jgi:AraC family transcriptional regulator
MPRSSEIKTKLEKPRMLQASIYDLSSGECEWNDETKFKTMAAYEVADFEHVPAGMETLKVGNGKYALFTYKGAAPGVKDFYGNIFSVWLPENKLEMDMRSDFEVYDERFVGPMNPESEWDIYIPVK